MRTLGFRSVVPLLLVLLGGGGCAEGPGGGPTTVRAVLSHDPVSMSLLGKPDRNSEILAVQLTDSLVQFDETMRLRPRLAESWEFSDDHRTLTFKLRDGVRWHDGRPVTAADVLFSVEQVRDPAVDNRVFGPSFQDLVEIEAPDARTVKARFSEPPGLNAWRLPIIPSHLAESGVELITGSYAASPVGCGPFRFVRYLPGEEILLEANEDYWDGRPEIDRLLLKIWPEQRTSFHALLAGELDILVVTPDLWYEARQSEHASRLESFVYYRNSVWQVGWNQDGSNPFFDDVRVRRALTLALDRRGFIDRLLHGLGRVPTTSYHPDMPWTDPDLAPLPFDPAEAGRLLDAAGWSDSDGDGIRDRDGVDFSFTLMIIASTQQINDHMAAWQQQSWAEVGVEAKIEKLQWPQFRERRLGRQFQAAMYGLSFTPDPDQFDVYHSSARGRGYNYVGLSDPEVDRLLESGRTIFDEAGRTAVYHRLQHRLFELQPAAWLIHFAAPVLHDRRLEGVLPTPMDYWRTSAGPRLWRWSEAATGD